MCEIRVKLEYNGQRFFWALYSGFCDDIKKNQDGISPILMLSLDSSCGNFPVLPILEVQVSAGLPKVHGPPNIPCYHEAYPCRTGQKAPVDGVQ